MVNASDSVTLDLGSAMNGQPEAGPSRTAGLQVYLLGRFEVRSGQRVLVDRGWSRSKAKALLKLLALQRGHSLHREQVLDALWPELDPAAAVNQLRKNLHYLRAQLGARGYTGTAVTLAAEVLALAPETWVDADEFRALARAACLARADPTLYERALGLYAGDLLPEDLYDDWAEPAREQLRSLRLRLLTELGVLYEACGQLELAVERLQQLLQADPLHEEGHRLLMRVYARMGSRHRALRQYQLCRGALQRELGVEPSAETEALYRELVEGRTSIGGARRGDGDTTSLSPSPRPRVLAAPREPLFGRERELESAEAMLEETLGGAGRALLVSGVAGIGKTRFAQQLLTASEERGARTLVGRCYELEATIAFQPLRDILGQVVELAHEGPVAQALSRSLRLKRLLPEVEAEATPTSDPTLLQLELFNEVASLLAALVSTGRPLALLFDDLHAADEASLRLVHFLCRQIPCHPILLVATYRAEDASPGRPLAPLVASLKRERLAREIALGPLPERGVRLVAEWLLGGQPVGQELLRELVRYAEGNALFAHEIVNTLRDEGQIHFVDGAWRRRAGATAPVPGAGQDLLDRRMQRLDDDGRRVIQAAVVLGRSFDYRHLWAAVHLPERALLDALDRCIGAFSLEEAEHGYRFRHQLLREAVYGRLTRARRQRLHREVAAVLAEIDSEAAEAIGYHFAQSDGPWRAAPFLRAAARRAASVFANEQALALYEQARSLLRDHPSYAQPRLVASVVEELGDLKTRAGETAATWRSSKKRSRCTPRPATSSRPFARGARPRWDTSPAATWTPPAPTWPRPCAT